MYRTISNRSDWVGKQFWLKLLAQALVRSDLFQPLAVLLDAIWIQVADADGDQCRVDAARRGGRV